MSNVGGIYVANYAEKLNTAKVIATNFTDDVKDAFKVGDRVLLAKGGDVVQLGTTVIYIYKQDSLVCSIED